MLRLVELHVRKYRDLVDGGPLRFGPGPVFLLGPNGSGKTTLLELIGVLLGDDLGPLFKEEEAVELSWVLEAEGVGETPTTRLELSLTIEAIPRSTTTDARTAKQKRRGWKISGVLPGLGTNEEMVEFWQDSDGAQEFRLPIGTPLRLKTLDLVPSEPGWLSYLGSEIIIIETLYHEGTMVHGRLGPFEERPFIDYGRRFDEACALFDMIVGDHAQPIEIEIEDDLDPTEPVLDLPDWVSFQARKRTPQHSDLVLLTSLLGADHVEFRPRLLSDNGRGRRRWRGFDIYVHWGGGAMHHHSELSFGQKRLIALIWRVGIGVQLPLITDELTNGLHAGWVQAIIDHLGPRQGFHAVQNPLLLDRYGPGESAADVAGRFVLCTVETAERGRQWRWRPPTPDECERLWQAYIAGYQHLSELLISEGLW